MSTYLIQITIGPVQDFIASARKLRDLWFGSDMLSELSKTIARSLHDQGAELIFPAIDDKSDERGELEKDSQLIVANKILVQMTTEADPAILIQQAKADWQAHQSDIAQIALDKIHDIKTIAHRFNDNLFAQQLSDFGEFYAAWVEMTGNYSESKNKLEKLLASRKNLRAFNAPQWQGAGIPKSSLDGIREAVIGDNTPEIKGLLKKNERLDALACIKRFYPLKNKKRTCFDDLSRIALSSYKHISERYDPGNMIKKFTQAVDMSDDWTNDSEAFYADKKALKSLNAFKEYQDMKTIFGEPNKYACVLMGDGDHMGLALDAIADAQGHQCFSQQLGVFAANINDTIAQHDGTLIYAGGDDVMAYVPLHSALACADEVQQKFVTIMKTIISDLDLDISVPTLYWHSHCASF
jgi:CRISPR-associated protein Cmr2